MCVCVSSKIDVNPVITVTLNINELNNTKSKIVSLDKEIQVYIFRLQNTF